MLAAKEVSFKFKGRSLLDRVSVQFQPGILYGVLGPNGSGKTTFLKVLSGIWTPTDGEVLWKGGGLHQKPRQEVSRLISLVPQNPTLSFDFTAYEMIAMGRYPHGQSGKTPRERELINEALRLVDASALADRYVSQLSVGERQRLYIARSLVTEAPVLLLDEPTASLDVRHEMEIWRILDALLMAGKIVITAIHNLSAAKKYCRQIVVLKDGKCRGIGAFDEVLSKDLFMEVYGIPK